MPILVVDDRFQYADLDELIVNHVQTIVRKLEELMAHERFKHSPEDELCVNNFFLVAHGAHGFRTRDCRRPEHFNLCFLAK